MNKPHRYADVIKAWADGEEIQYRMIGVGKSEWMSDSLGSPAFDAVDIEWRIKPETLRYRVALICDGDKLTFDIAETEENIKQIEDENSGFKFVKWLTDWQEADV